MPAPPGADRAAGGARAIHRLSPRSMYLAVLTVITGQALVLGRPALLGYAAGVGAAFTESVYGYEQPALARRYAAQYQA